MQYTLTLNLEGADKVTSTLDSLLSKLGGLGGNKKLSFDDWLSHDPMATSKEGEKAGESFSNGFKKKSIQIMDFWNKALVKGISDRAIIGLKEPTGKDLSKVQSLPDINSLTGPKADWKKILTGVGLGFSNPYVGSRLLSDELGKGSGGGIAGGLFGKGGIAGFSEIFFAFKAFRFAVDMFKRAAEIFKSATGRASKLYSGALQNGMGLQFSTKRSLMASIMGVSEQDVFRFGAQMAYLNPKLEQASKILAQTATPLTQTSWQIKILEANFQALVAELSAQLNPSISSFIELLDSLVKKLQEYTILLNIAGRWFWHGGGLLGGVSAAGNAAADMAKNKFGKSDLPNPQAWMKQLPASSWEKMGLVTMGGGQNYQKDIAKNTKDTAKGLRQLIGAIRKKAGDNWDMGSDTNNP